MRHRATMIVIMMLWIVEVTWATSAPALNEPTHAIINEQAARQSQLDQLLKALRLPGGIEEPLNGRTALRWLREGGIQEDLGDSGDFLLGRARSLRHFHDPWEPSWDTAGLQIPIPPRRFESSVRWMQRADQGSQAVGGNWGWPTARTLFYDALTKGSPQTREARFADLFRALGQLMHLVTDASVPEHTRNDPHPQESLCRGVGRRCYGNYEYWVSDQHGKPGSTAEIDFIARFLADPYWPDTAILQQPTGDNLARVPVARLIDTKMYKGSGTPSVTVGPAIGIAEVSHANFFSEDTGNNRLLGRKYPFPSVDLLERSTLAAPGTGYVRAYLKKVVDPVTGYAADGGLPVDPVLAECIFHQAARDEGVAQPILRNCTDANIWDRVANEMLPRAVGYSAALLDYFFRGRLEPSLVVREDSTAQALRATLVIRNPSPDEAMAGTFELYTEKPDGTRESLAQQGGKWELTLAPGEQSAPLQFMVPLETPRPPWLLVFHGTLGREAPGSEQGAVGAVAARWVEAAYIGYLRKIHSPTPGSGDDVSAVGPPAEGYSLVDYRLSSTVLVNTNNSDNPSRDWTFIFRDLKTHPGHTLALYNLFTWHLEQTAYSVLVSQPWTVDILELEEPENLLDILSYTWTNPPTVRRVIATLTGPTPPNEPVYPPIVQTVEIGDVRFLGFRVNGYLDPLDAPPMIRYYSADTLYGYYPAGGISGGWRIE